MRVLTVEVEKLPEEPFFEFLFNNSKTYSKLIDKLLKVVYELNQI